MRSNVFFLDASQFEKLEQSMKQYEGNVEQAINEVLHNEGGQLIHDEIKRLMPHSGNRTWKGKKPHAKESNSLRFHGGNLFVTVRTQKAYQYLYFPDSGENTVNHMGNQQFFQRSVENKREEVVNLCIGRLVGVFNETV